jgi:hypothetical protein
MPFEYQGYVGGFIWARLNAGREFPAIGNAAACYFHLFNLPSSYLFTCHLFVLIAFHSSFITIDPNYAINEFQQRRIRCWPCCPSDAGNCSQLVHLISG